MHNLPLSALRAYAAVFETGGVRSAARSLAITHSSVWRHVRELELWLGAALFEPRQGRRALRFTPQGQALGRAAMTGLRELADAVEVVREARQSNSVVIAAAPSIAVRWLLPRMHTLAASHPHIEVSVITEQAPLNLKEQRADLAVRMGAGPWPSCRCEPLMDDVLFPVAHPNYWRRVAKGRRGLAAVRLIHDRDPHASWGKWFAAYPLPGVDLRVGPRYTSSDLVLRAAAQGLGVALARGRLACDDLASGALIRPLGASKVELANAYWLVRPEVSLERAAVTAAAAWITSEARSSAANSEL